MAAQVETGFEVVAERSAIATTFMRYLPLLIIAAVWEFSSRVGLVSQLALPSLSSVLVAWVELFLPSNPSPGLVMSYAGIGAWLHWLVSGDLIGNGLDSLWRLGMAPFGRAMKPSRLVPTKTDALMGGVIPVRSGLEVQMHQARNTSVLT